MVGSIEYGTATSSVRDGNKVSKGEQIYLDRVVDKELGIFKSRERGLFAYDVGTNSFSAVLADFVAPKIKRKKRHSSRPSLHLSFGDIFLLDEYLKKSG